MQSVKALALAALVLTGSLASPLAASAETMLWKFNTAGTGDVVNIKLYSQVDEQEWPSNSTMWQITDDDTHTYRISCVYEENICFGAWVEGDTTEYWGTGYNDLKNVPGACHICGYEKAVYYTLHD